jgi:hypothetical protein
MIDLDDNCDVRDATHVKTRDGRVEKIRSTWGIDPNGCLAPPSRGGFGVVTIKGERVSMWDAMAYFEEI